MSLSVGEEEQKVHFTYTAEPDMISLCQGDILTITPELTATLGEVHPYFINSQYKYFIVLTQSCDLVRRNGQPCKSQYITLAAIREFSDFFNRIMISNHYADCINGLLLMENETKSKATQLIERIYNNTEPDYFFLYKDEFLDFPVSMVAYLKVSIALKAVDHYDECLAAKKIELSDEFKAKLGWLVGNIYSRVGTKDWDSLLDKRAKERMFAEEIETRCILGEKEKIKALKKELESNGVSTTTDANEFLSNFHIESRYEKVIGILQKILDDRGDKLPGKEKGIILNYIKSNSELRILLNKKSE